MAVTRPILRYHGGKWKLASWIISHFPAHRIYVEPFGGGGSVLVRKQPVHAEVYNDLDGDMVNVFRVLRDPDQATRLRALLELTPYARDEFLDSYKHTEDPVERARRTLTRTALAFSTASRRQTRTGFRATPVRASSTTGIQDWRSFPAHIPAIVHRLSHVILENRPAAEVIAQQDNPDVLFYCDPPYVHSTRTLDSIERHRAYVHEMSDAEHRELAEQLHGIEGMAIISGYPGPLYDELYGDWHRVSKRTTAGAAGARRIEVLWISPKAESASRPLFAHI